MAAFNFHKRQTRRWWYAGVTLVAAAAFSVFWVAGASAVTGSPSQFESSDGNMVLDSTGNTDWNCFQGTGGFQSSASYGTGFSKSDCAVTSGAVNSNIGQEANEITWKSGQKFDTACPTTITGSVPNKDDFVDISEYSEFDSNGNLYFYGGAIRQVANGNSSGNVEFNQNTGTAGCRSDGDKLIAYDFQNGGTNLVFHVLTWITSSTEGKCFVKTDNPANGCWRDDGTPSGTHYDGEGNQSTIAAGDNGLNGAAMDINQFSEFGINLSQALGGGDVCFPQQTWESRSSGSSFTSNPEDIEAIQYQLCGSITIVKHTLNSSGTRAGLNVQFPYTTSGATFTPSTFHLNDAGGATGDVNCTNSSGVYADSTTTNPCNTVTNDNLTPGTYSFTEGSVANYALYDLSCTNNGDAVSSSTTGPLTITNSTASITLAAHDNWVCTYTNKQQLGAIRIKKVSSKTDTNGNNLPLSGASFTYAPVTNGTAGTATAFPNTTDSNGYTCVSGLAFGTYRIAESSAPTGYAKDSNTQDVTVSSSGNCTTGYTSATNNFVDTPLSKIYLGWHSLAGTGVTTATINCTGDTADSAFTDSGAPGTTGTITPTKTLGNGTSTLTPGTYACTVVIDP